MCVSYLQRKFPTHHAISPAPRDHVLIFYGALRTRDGSGDQTRDGSIQNKHISPCTISLASDPVFCNGISEMEVELKKTNKGGVYSFDLLNDLLCIGHHFPQSIQVLME